MRFNTYSLLLLALLAVLPFAHSARAEESNLSAEQVHEKRDSFARDFAQKVLAIIQDQKKNYTDRKDVLRQAFSKSVDIDWIAKFVLGKAWSAATPEQKDTYTKLYRKYLTETYVSNFAENPDKRIRDIKIYGVNDGEEDNFTVRTKMMLADMNDLKVNYLVRETEGKYKVLDIIIENVSLITAHRGEFSKMATAHGIDGVIKWLEQWSKDGKALGANPGVSN